VQPAGKDVIETNATRQESDGGTRLAYILGVPLAENVVRQWPQMEEVVRTSKLIADVEGNFPGLTTPEWRRSVTDRLDMPGDGIWPDAEHLGHH
jgi:hypothetical protein